MRIIHSSSARGDDFGCATIGMRIYCRFCDIQYTLIIVVTTFDQYLGNNSS